MKETRYPLCWPANWPRSKSRTRAQFGKASPVYRDGQHAYDQKTQLTVSGGFDRVQKQLELMGIPPDGVIVSTNVVLNLSGAPHSGRAEPHDPGVAVYWKRKGKDQCMAIDRYDRVADNLAAVAATLEALRAVERHGGGTILDRAFTGFAQLPASIITPRPWREVLKFGLSSPTVEMIETRYRSLAHSAHPDKGGTHEGMTELNQARADALREIN